MCFLRRVSPLLWKVAGIWKTAEAALCVVITKMGVFGSLVTPSELYYFHTMQTGVVYSGLEVDGERTDDMGLVRCLGIA